ncbi:MAG TPA: hypothetical protein VHU77_01040 [Candidatus Limnocylindria bacterium]|nr:hypothetical protein [Candidatus Limnocylindria bacterium]
MPEQRPTVGIWWRAAGASWWAYAVLTVLPVISLAPSLLSSALIRATLAVVLGVILWRGGGRWWAVLALLLSFGVFPFIFLAVTAAPPLYLLTSAPMILTGLASFVTAAYCLWSTFKVDAPPFT